MNREGAEVTSAGRSFQTRAPATEKARRPTVGSLTAGTHKSSEVEDRSHCGVGMLATDVNGRILRSITVQCSVRLHFHHHGSVGHWEWPMTHWPISMSAWRPTGVVRGRVRARQKAPERDDRQTDRQTDTETIRPLYDDDDDDCCCLFVCVGQFVAVRKTVSSTIRTRRQCTASTVVRTATVRT